ncbi:hypothetical protein KFY51_30435, partial [Salmonella enterica subsp. enterica serovar 1,4,[5],12:i:-]|nr:hypothetical protein [Salmonella enterica subsp. enterica serovar 1,4,[5],12:i:-]
KGRRSAASSPGPSMTPSNRPPGQPNAGVNLPGAGYPAGADKNPHFTFQFSSLTLFSIQLFIIKILGCWFI